MSANVADGASKSAITTPMTDTPLTPKRIPTHGKEKRRREK